jgi:MoxR-like ATPase
MEIRERQRLYKEAVAQDPTITPQTRISDAFGVSNSAKIVERGLFAFNANFNTFGADIDQVVVHCLLRFPPEDEIYFSLFIRSDLEQFRARLEEMRAAGTSRPRRRAGAEPEDEAADEDESEASDTPATAESPDVLSYTNNNKNVKGYLALDGRLYLRNKSYWDALPEDLSTISRPVTLDRIVFGIYPPAASARRSLLAREFVGYLGSLIGRDRVHEIQVWPDESAVHENMRRLPPSISISEIESNVSGMGGFYPGGEVSRFHAALNFLSDKHFVILSGLSGTGKTQLAIRYAKAVHGLTDQTAGDPFLFVCPVRPEWTDPTGLTGYYDVLSDRYMVPPFLEAVMVATAHRDSPVFVVLDEMNLAPVEYYLSDVLSCIETGEMLQLHSNSVPLEGSTGSTIRAQMPLPPNLYLIGTINIDETTNPISDKVLDRAIVIDMSAVELKGFLEQLEQQDPNLADAKAACEATLVAVYDLMAQHGLGFGYRVAEEVVRYHAFTREHLTALTPEQTTDDLMVQKVLVKLRGGERQRTLLTGLRTALDGLPRSQTFIDRLIADLDEFGSFQASR